MEPLTIYAAAVGGSYLVVDVIEGLAGLNAQKEKVNQWVKEADTLRNEGETYREYGERCKTQRFDPLAYKPIGFVGRAIQKWTYHKLDEAMKLKDHEHERMMRESEKRPVMKAPEEIGAWLFTIPGNLDD